MAPGLLRFAAWCGRVPRPPRVRETSSFGAKITTTPTRELASKPVFVLFLLTREDDPGSHAIYYSYGGLHWREQGIDAFTIGLIWPLGIIAEILTGSVVRRVSPVALMALGAAACVLRWTLMAFECTTLGLSQLVPARSHLPGAASRSDVFDPQRNAAAARSDGTEPLWRGRHRTCDQLGVTSASAYYAAWGAGPSVITSAMGALAILTAWLLGLIFWNGKRITESCSSEDHGGV